MRCGILHLSCREYPSIMLVFLRESAWKCKKTCFLCVFSSKTQALWPVVTASKPTSTWWIETSKWKPKVEIRSSSTMFLFSTQGAWTSFRTMYLSSLKQGTAVDVSFNSFSCTGTMCSPSISWDAAKRHVSRTLWEMVVIRYCARCWASSTTLFVGALIKKMESSFLDIV